MDSHASTAQVRLLIESGILVLLLSFAWGLGVYANRSDAQAARITELEIRQQRMDQDLVKTREQIINDLATIKAHMGIRGR